MVDGSMIYEINIDWETDASYDIKIVYETVSE
jgi:hypothetical protein